MWSDEPDQQAKWLVAAIFFQPRQCAVNSQIVWIHVAILLFRADLTLPAFLEEWAFVVIGSIIMSEVVIPVTFFDTVRNMHLAEDGNLVAGFVENVGKERNIRRQWDLQMLVRERSGGARVHASQRHCARRCAESIGAECILKAHALAADAVVIGRLENCIARDGERVGTLAFPEEKDQIWTLCSRFGQQVRRSDGRGEQAACDDK